MKLIAAIDSGTLSELDRRIKAEMFWQADIYVREKIFDAAEMACERASARRVREKLRLIGLLRRRR